MGFFKSLWKGVKNVVKGVAKSVKRVAKAVVTALPGGDKLWEFGTKVGTKLKEGVGKFMSKLGPIGSMALSFVLAPIMGPAVSFLWKGFGAAAVSMSAAGNAIVAGLGKAGLAVFNGANFVGGTLGAMGNAITKGVGQVAKGNFGAAGDAFLTNMKSAFTGEAGSASMSKALAGVTKNSAINNAVFDPVNGPKLAQTDLASMPDGGVGEFGLKPTPTAADQIAGLDRFDPLAGTKLNPTGPSPLADASMSDFANTMPKYMPETPLVGPPASLANPTVEGTLESIGMRPGAVDPTQAAASFQEPKSLMQKTMGALKKGASALSGAGGAGGEAADLESFGSPATREYNAVKAAGENDQIYGVADNGFFKQLIANAGRA